MTTKTKCLLVLLLLMIIDTLPVPVLGLLGLHVILNRPPWFLQAVRRLYQDGEGGRRS
jgi:hypothetical protein